MLFFYLSLTLKTFFSSINCVSKLPHLSENRVLPHLLENKSSTPRFGTSHLDYRLISEVFFPLIASGQRCKQQRLMQAFKAAQLTLLGCI